MKIVGRIDLSPPADLFRSHQWREIEEEVETAIQAIVWPPQNDRFTIFGVEGVNSKESDENGVKPIKDACMLTLRDRYYWETRDRKNPLQFDATRILKPSGLFGLEWETGNISSSHRSVNRILLGCFQNIIRGGILIIPSNELYLYLTDRIGNIGELEPYIPIWKDYIARSWNDGVFRIYVVEQDAVSLKVPKIIKMTDGMAIPRRAND
jgi:hypothetical protein